MSVANQACDGLLTVPDWGLRADPSAFEGVPF
jgi:hypothetical protein